MALPRIFRSSIFTKLILLLFITWLCINLLLAILFKQIIHPHQPPFQRTLISYMDYLIKDLGYPPSFEKALDISRQVDIDIDYHSPEISWTTAPAIFKRLEHFPRIKKDNQEFTTRFSRGRLYVSREMDNGRYTIATHTRPISSSVEKRLFFSSLLLLFLILTLVYFTIRWIMKPIRLLSKGAEAIAGGNLEHKIPIRRSDELGDLVRTFNSMAERIQDQIQAKEKLLLDVSHELRSPLTRMKVALELLPESEPRQNLNEDLMELEGMITELLESARLERKEIPLEKYAFSINDLLLELKPFYRSQEPGLSLHIVEGENIIRGDRRQIKTVLTNILNNAFKYSGTAAKPVEVEIYTNNKILIVQIKDHGPGIPEEDLNHVFEPFYRVDKSRSKKTGGYGLGLSLCKKIMEAHQGDISIESELGSGTTVTVSFPRENLGRD